MDWFLLSLLGAFLLSAADIVQKKVLKTRDPLEFTLTLYFLGAIVLLPLFFSFDVTSLTVTQFCLVFLRGTLVSLGVYFFGKALKVSNISYVAPVMNFSIVILVIFSFFLLNERLSFFELIGVMLIMFGGYLLNAKKGQNIKETFSNIVKNQALHYVIFTMILFSLAIILEKYLFGMVYIATQHFLFLAYVSSFLTMLFLFVVEKKKINSLISNIKYMGFPVFIFTFFDLASTFVHLKAVAIPAAKVSLIIPVRRLSTFFDVLAGGKMFHEEHILKKSIATAIMIAGIFIMFI